MTELMDGVGFDDPDLDQKVIANFRANGGRVGGIFAGVSMLILHSVGARSGAERVTPLGCLQRPGGWAIFASNGGESRNPGWFHNLVADPDARVEVAGELVTVTARVVDGDERAEIWDNAGVELPGYAHYQQDMTRIMPVVVLERRDR